MQKYQLACCWSNWAQQAADWGFAPSPFCARPSITPGVGGERRAGALGGWGCMEVGAHQLRSSQLAPREHPWLLLPISLSLAPHLQLAPDRTVQSFFSLGLAEASETCQCLMKPHFHWLAPLKIFHLSVPRFKYFPLAGSQVCLVDYVARPFTSALTMLQQVLMSSHPPLPPLPPPAASLGWQSLDLFHCRPVLLICAKKRKCGGREGERGG